MKKEIVIQNFPYIKCFYLKVAKLLRQVDVVAGFFVLVFTM
jgi:hypothetical protein